MKAIIFVPPVVHHSGHHCGPPPTLLQVGVIVLLVAYLIYLLFVIIEFTTEGYRTKWEFLLDLFIPFRSWILGSIDIFRNLE